MSPGNLKKDLKRWKDAVASSIWRRGGSHKANADALKSLRAAIIDDVLKIIKQHRGQAAKKAYITPAGALDELAEAVEKLKD